MLALPSVRDPRLLVPSAPARVAAGAVTGLAADRSWPAVARRRAVATALRLGAARLGEVAGRSVLVGTGGIDAHLADLLGERVSTGLLVGSPRANRKPVLVVLDRRGRPLAFAKLGATDLTRALVLREADALRTLGAAAVPGLVTPRLLHEGTWGGAALVLQSPLAAGAARRTRHEVLLRAVRAIAGRSSVEHPVALGETPGWRAVLSSLDAHPGPVAARLRVAAAAVEARADSGLVLGAWHGDLTPWNAAAVADDLLVWDWERYESGVPLGYDLLHHRMAVLTRVQGRSHAEAARLVVATATDVLSGLVPASAAGGTALAYLVSIGTRYLVDGQAAAGHRSGRVEEWLLPLLEERTVGLRR